ncbi:hypothetical protein BDV95DRAFT_483909 [Massariosphaeria phaeospora]|uniref:5-Methylcytosine G/T mismatch-specific DNA glycosylase n=1 Tax=Massariosphaeria phaeospora TaxID=100035 RepID=A0A7C8ICF0_9PLEO|nr:hypothetical protein BDV95DRAFT_483909 [Massariosphaeria phaeospora]
MLSSSEPRRRKKDPDRERSSPKSKDKDRDKDKERHRSSKTSRSSRKPRSSASKEEDGASERRPEYSSRERARTSSSTQVPKSHRMAVVPELERRSSVPSPNASRTSLPYPTFSKTHSKESIYSRSEVAEREQSPFTPETTDVGDGPQDQGKERSVPQAPTRAPPSPPLTVKTATDLRKTASANSMRRNNSEALHKEMEGGRRSVDTGTHLTPEPRFAASRSSVREGDMADGTDLTSTTGSQPSTVRGKPPKMMPPKVRTGSPLSGRSPERAGTTTTRSAPREVSEVSEISALTDSDATSVAAAAQQNVERLPKASVESDVSPSSLVSPSPRTPTRQSLLPSVISATKSRPPTVEIIRDPASRAQSVDQHFSYSSLPPPPPPPPPALTDPPRVDYLLQNGGLPHPVPRSMLAAMASEPVVPHSQYASPFVAGPMPGEARDLFEPLLRLLDNYSAVIDKSGSIAVATGYRSIARRLLDRLEAVFARNISGEHCDCIMCMHEDYSLEEERVVNWGEILELVSGRCELPAWPPFPSTPVPTGLGIGDLEPPCTSIDEDVPEQFHAHYATQSKKTKVAVQSWLSDQRDAPEEADDDTLTFAMLTRISPIQRPVFYALLYGMDHLPQPRQQLDKTKGTPPSVAKAGLALQRLYRLHTVPKDQLTVMYLLRNAEMHSILATLAAITKHEWEILTSGRFDGFLWSGVETKNPVVDSPSLVGWKPSPFSMAQYDTPTPGPCSRPGSTHPTTGPAPVQMDEDTEIAVLAEVEREIFLSMESMEDAFEQLHNKAEVIRRRLRERGAALSMVAHARRGFATGGPDVRVDTPATRGVEVDPELEDLRTEVGPDDSASNVSRVRRNRENRVKARTTPAPLEEDPEEKVGRKFPLRPRKKH